VFCALLKLVLAFLMVLLELFELLLVLFLHFLDLLVDEVLGVGFIVLALLVRFG
jgi:hypothetical protein